MASWCGINLLPFGERERKEAERNVSKTRDSLESLSGRREIPRLGREDPAGSEPAAGPRARAGPDRTGPDSVRRGGSALAQMRQRRQKLTPWHRRRSSHSETIQRNGNQTVSCGVGANRNLLKFLLILGR
ncbi:unnamed protein product [Caretta caretta]